MLQSEYNNHRIIRLGRIIDVILNGKKKKKKNSTENTVENGLETPNNYTERGFSVHAS